ncbi:MAG: prephenate dehydratase [Proteobacteria bacterium]|nr:prephenate dehydratase [Pseudomonadota bacterium]
MDAIDSQILNLINLRLETGIKTETGTATCDTPVIDRNYEQKHIEKLFSMNKGPASKELIQYIFNTIIHATRQIQRPITISFLGPRASYTHMAALSHFMHSGQFVEQVNLYDIFREVEKNKSHYGVVPVENSIEGAVNHTLDLFSSFDLKICAEHYEPISHTLLSLTGNPEDVKKIYSHPQALAQCRGWIKKNHPQVELFETSSTSKAAFLASEDKSIAAIASRKAAQIYTLQTVESCIEDHSGNITRFLIIGKDMPEPTGNDKTSIMFATTHVPGALFKTLEPVDKAGLNMLKLESRPTRDQNWSYYFFMDIEGHYQDKKVSQTIEEIKNLSLSLKILGSYPVFSTQDNNAAF